MLGGTNADTTVSALDYYNGNGYTVFGGNSKDTSLISAT
jgi:hypothetical protein